MVERGNATIELPSNLVDDGGCDSRSDHAQSKLGLLAAGDASRKCSVSPSSAPRAVVAAACFLMLIAAALVSTFKRYSSGPFALYVDPSKYLSTKFTAGEIRAFKVGVYMALSGFLVIAVTSLVA